jgi:hypothetical protein
MIEDKIQKGKKEICSTKLYEACGRKDDVMLNNIVNIRDCRNCKGYDNKCKNYDPIK